jgi:hypothetical protein
METTMNLFRTTIAAMTVATGLVAANAASAYERWIDVVNLGDTPIAEVRISHVDDPNYGRDLTGRYVIPVGDVMRVEPDINNGYCRFDILIEFVGGEEVTLWRVNLCEATTLYTDGYGWDVDYI